MHTSPSRQMAVRLLQDVYALIERDAGAYRSKSAVVSSILERHYEADLAKIRIKATRKVKQ